MPKLFVLDPSLHDVGGHHYDYDYHVVCAAQKLGYQTILATHHTFAHHDSFPESCEVIPLFRYHTYNRYSELAGIRSLQSDERKAKETSRGLIPFLSSASRSVSNWLDRRKAANPARGRHRRSQSFAQDCAKLFNEFKIEHGDHVFLPTLSELDLLGLARFLKDTPKTPSVDWHVQFHFNLFEGREPDYRTQFERVASIRQQLRKAIDQISQHKVHYYTTSEPLARQYNLLGVAGFDSLAYPVNPRFHTQPVRREDDGPLRITCAGVPRHEKGQTHFRDIVREMWRDYFDTGDVQLVIQSKAWDFDLGQSLPWPKPGRHRQEPMINQPIVYMDHPLPIDQYAELIQRADIGLLMYDSERYYARRAGVLGEMLTAGVPVVVPAGCWLSEQIAEPIFQHIEDQAERLQTMDVVTLGNVEFGDDSNSHECVMDVPAGATEVSIEFNWRTPAQAGSYVRLLCNRASPFHQTPDFFETIVGQRESGKPSVAWIHLKPNTRWIRITWSNAYGVDPIHIRNASVRFLSNCETGPQSVPAGQVGLIAANEKQVPELLDDMIRHYGHYKETAEARSQDWYERHDPCRTVSQLIEKESTLQSYERRAA